jgi:hypothetical protein
VCFCVLLCAALGCSLPGARMLCAQPDGERRAEERGVQGLAM